MYLRLFIIKIIKFNVDDSLHCRGLNDGKKIGLETPLVQREVFWTAASITRLSGMRTRLKEEIESEGKEKQS